MSNAKVDRLKDLVKEADVNLNHAAEAVRQLDEADPATKCLLLLVEDLAGTVLKLATEMQNAIAGDDPGTTMPKIHGGLGGMNVNVR